MIELRVVVQPGVAQALSNTSPLFASAFKRGVLGVSRLRLYCAEESRPWSSEMISKIFGRVAVVVGVWVAAGVGLAVGAIVGAAVGFVVGAVVGIVVGVGAGFVVGEGLAVGVALVAGVGVTVVVGVAVAVGV